MYMPFDSYYSNITFLRHLHHWPMHKTLAGQGQKRRTAISVCTILLVKNTTGRETDMNCGINWEALSAIGTMLTAIATILAVVMACLAYFESLRMRKNSAFNTMFSQLIASHKIIFEKNKLCAEFHDIVANKLNHINTTQDFCVIWRLFCAERRIGAVHFSHSFKYVYHEVKTVLDDTTIDEKAKRHYIGIIQAMMNKHELFCYLVSLLQHFEKYPDDENDYREQLKQYNFFADIMRKHDPLYTDLMEHLTNQLYIDVSKIINI